MSKRKFKDLTGQRFNKLVVLKLDHRQENFDKHGTLRGSQYMWLCLCDCGNEKVIGASTLVHGNTKSCGCKFKERTTLSYTSQRAFTNTYNRYRHRAAHEYKKPFTLTKEEFYNLCQQNCTYCDSPPSNTCKSKNSVYVYNGLDRIDSSLGYEPGNCVPCCKFCNQMKSDMTVEEFKNWVIRIVENNKDAE